MTRQPNPANKLISFERDSALEVSGDLRCALQTIDPSAVLHFPNGLPAFEHIKEFALIFNVQVKPFLYLQALDDSQVCFVCLEPFVVWPQYTINIPAACARLLRLPSPQSALILSLVTVGEQMCQTTVNLMSPVVVNLKERLGAQLILESCSYPVRYRVWDALQPELVQCETVG